jgi:hypothetical protein
MRLRVAATALLSLALLTGASASWAETQQNGNLRITFEGSFTPRSLPRQRLAPITTSVAGSIATTDGSHPPPLRRLKVSINRNGKLSGQGLPVCPSAALQSTSTDAALAICRSALVGRGRFSADVAFAGESASPATGTIVAFNSRHDGKSSLLLHLYATVPVRATLVLPLTILHPRKGQFGTVLTGAIPILAGGLGSITHIELKLGRQYRYRGERRSYLSASCGTPAGFTRGTFPFVRGTFLFGGHRRFNTVLTRTCRVR